MTYPLAVLGADPAFSTTLPVGQLFFPTWTDYERSFRDIFDRQYYTNHGPLAVEFERKLEAFFDVTHVICVTNATIGLVMAAEALSLKGKVITPSFTFVATPQSLAWANIEPVFCDVDPITHQMTAELVEPLISEDVSGILAVNLWGGSCEQTSLENLARDRGLKIYYDSAHAFGCSVNGKPIGGFGELEVFSFHATKIFSSAEGGCLTTNNDDIAKRLRNIRSSYGAGPVTPIDRSSNGRMSEAQAAIGLLSLEMYEASVASNFLQFNRYEHGLGQIEGLQLYKPANVNKTNFQYVVVAVDEAAFGLSRDQIVKALKAENIHARRYFYPGAHRSYPWGAVAEHSAKSLPTTEDLCDRLFQLPIGARLKLEDIERICAILSALRDRATDVRKELER